MALGIFKIQIVIGRKEYRNTLQFNGIYGNMPEVITHKHTTNTSEFVLKITLL